MNRTLLASLLLLTGCASSGVTATHRPDRVDVRSGDGRALRQYTFVMTSDDRVVSSGVHAPADRVWQAAGQAYQTLGLPINRLEATTRIIGSQPAVSSRRLAGEALSAALDCGLNAARAPIVNAYAVSFAVTTKVTASGDSTLVETLVQARAQDSIHNNPSVSCSSTGRLESRIAAAIREAAGS